LTLPASLRRRRGKLAKSETKKKREDDPIKFLAPYEDSSMGQT